MDDIDAGIEAELRKKAPAERFDDRNRLCKWFPTVEKLNIPHPRTTLVPFKTALGIWLLSGETHKRIEKEDAKMHSFLMNEWQTRLEEIKAAARGYGYPVFIRTDEASGKHDWIRTCHVPDEASVPQHLYNIIEDNATADVLGLEYCHFAVREYMEPNHDFTAYRGMPVGLEYRLFARDGKYECGHPYWFPAALERGHHDPPLPQDWKHQMERMYDNSNYHLQRGGTLATWAEKVTRELGGYWSVDFLSVPSRPGSPFSKWILTDMALGDASYHLLPCPMAKGRTGAEQGDEE